MREVIAVDPVLSSFAAIADPSWTPFGLSDTEIASADRLCAERQDTAATMSTRAKPGEPPPSPDA